MDSHVLAIDAAGHACSVAIAREQEGGEVFQRTQWIGRGHAAALAPLVQAALGLSNPAAISALVVTRGPGGFTGMRAGLAFARAFALARSIPIYGMDSFAALRLTVGPTTPCLIDSRRGDFFYDTLTADLLNLPAPGTQGIGIVSNDDLPTLPKAPAGSIWKTKFCQDLSHTPPRQAGWIEPCPIQMALYGLKRLKSAADTGAGTCADTCHEDLSPFYVRAPSLG